MKPAPVRVSTIGPVSCGALAWQHRGATNLTVVVKATFALVPEGVAAVREPAELVARDLSFDKDPAQSLERASDWAPWRPMADVTLTGHAYAPPGRPVAAMSVRLAVVADQ